MGQTDKNQIAMQINALIYSFKKYVLRGPLFQTYSRLEECSAKNLEAYILAGK